MHELSQLGVLQNTKESRGFAECDKERYFLILQWNVLITVICNVGSCSYKESDFFLSLANLLDINDMFTVPDTGADPEPETDRGTDKSAQTKELHGIICWCLSLCSMNISTQFCATHCLSVSVSGSVALNPRCLPKW